MKKLNNTSSPLFANASLSEQMNSKLTAFKRAASHMSQLTLLWLLRNVLYEMGRKSGAGCTSRSETMQQLDEEEEDE